MESKIRHAVYANTADTNLSPKTVFVIDQHGDPLSLEPQFIVSS